MNKIRPFSDGVNMHFPTEGFFLTFQVAYSLPSPLSFADCAAEILKKHSKKTPKKCSKIV